MSTVWSHNILGYVGGARGLVGLTPDVGAAWELFGSAADPTISSSGQPAYAGNTTAACGPATSAGSTALTLQYVASIVDSDVSKVAAVLRATGPSGTTYYEVGIYRSFGTNDIVVYRFVSGTPTLISSTSYSLTLSTYYDLEFSCINDGSGNPVLTVKVGGSTVHTYTDTSGSKITSGQRAYVNFRYANISSAQLLDDAGGGGSAIGAAAHYYRQMQ